MAALQQQHNVPRLALRVLALALLDQAGPGEAAGAHANKHAAAAARATPLSCVGAPA